MASPMGQVPTDIFACIVEYLSRDDLCTLGRVAKAYHIVVQPLLWTVIEMHGADFHVKTIHKALRAEEAKDRMMSPYNTGLPVEEQYYTDDQARSRGEEFLKKFSGDQARGTELRKGRKEELGALVRWLCLPTNTKAPNALAKAFAHFVNLEHLEISMFWELNSGMDIFHTPLPGLQKLRTLKLRGYLPKKFVRWLLTEPGRIEELQLAILDRPVGSSNCFRANPPSLAKQKLEDMEDVTEDELAKAEEYQLMTSDEYIAPRALACLTPEIMSRLVSLKRLYLSKPSSGAIDDEGFLYFSTLCDKRILQEWNALLRATRNTLRHLTLDQRAVAYEDVADRSNNRSYMRQCSNGPSYARFVEMVLPALLESKSCPNLEVIRLFGFEAHEEGVDEFHRIHVDYPNSSIHVPGQLRAAFPNAEVLDYAGRRLVISNDSGEVQSGESVPAFEAMQSCHCSKTESATYYVVGHLTDFVFSHQVEMC
ncbi:hypothetical protein G6011_08425 [Alternaria panax]|uniref:F-box domain-containing protein n=1 Tax=Alternaria panax TaxID=48097 RepID=A0AAD4FIA5_9PLEO|nr:hypothetical protein G6011_08425 [Alternaria panax]